MAASISWKRSCIMLVMRGGMSSSVGLIWLTSSMKLDMSDLRTKWHCRHA